MSAVHLPRTTSVEKAAACIAEHGYVIIDELVPPETLDRVEAVLVISGKVYHGGGHNRSDRVRKALDIGYAVGSVRQEENQYLSCPPDIARTLPEPLLRLMGYEAVHGYGHVANREDPIRVLGPG